jgi:hypothetical protein
MVLNGHFDPQGDSNLNVTDCHFDWLPHVAYLANLSGHGDGFYDLSSGGSLPCDQSGYPYSSATSVTAFLNNLNPGGTYDFQLRVDTTSAGEFTGGDQTETMPLFFTDTPIQVGAFGNDGTASSTFSASNPGQLAFDNAQQRLYVKGSSGIYGFDVSSPPPDDSTPLSFPLVSGFNPLAASGGLIAVDNSPAGSAGRLYVADPTTQKLYGYSSNGSALGGSFPIDLTANPNFHLGNGPCGVGVDSTGGVWVSDPHFDDLAPILRYDSNGTVQSSLTEFFPCALVFDAENDLYVGREGGGNVFRAKAPSYSTDENVDSKNANQIAIDPSSDVVYVAESNTSKVAVYDHLNVLLHTFGDGVPGSVLKGIAIDPINHYLYVADLQDHKVHVFAPGAVLTPPTITQQDPTNVAGTTVTLRAKVDPEDIQVTDCRFEVVPDSQFQASGFTNVSAGEKHACSPDMTGPAGAGSGDVSVHADVAGLDGSTTYHSRIVASNGQNGGTATGSDQSFDTKGPRIRSTAADHISDTAATLHALVNPENADTTYQFQYTDDADFQSNGWSNAQVVPASPADIGGGSIAVEASENVFNLDPATTYDFRVVAQNSDATVDGPDTAFTTYTTPPTLGSCPNDQLRTGTGIALPDCRAYEQASPLDKNGADAWTSAEFQGVATDGNAVIYIVPSQISAPGGSGGSARPSQDVAHRTADGWVSTGVVPAVPSLDPARLLNYNDQLTADLSLDTITGTLYFGDLTNGTWTQITPSSVPSPLGDIGLSYSSDPSHFLGTSRYVLAPGASNFTGSDNSDTNLYDYDHGVFSLAGRVPPAGATSCDDQTGQPSCLAPAHGAFLGAYDWTQGSKLDFLGGGKHAFSTDGSRAVFTEAGTGRLYLREGGTRTVQINVPGAGVPADPHGHKPAAFMAASTTDSVIYFASCERLTADSTAVSTVADSCRDLNGVLAPQIPQRLQTMDLYRYETASGQLSDLTVDNGDPQGADVQGVVGASGDGSWLYFIANGSLAPGAPAGNCRPGNDGNMPNGSGSCDLYVSHDGQSPAYIATLPVSAAGALSVGGGGGNGRPGERAVVADDGTLIVQSGAQLTSYANYSDTCSLGGNNTGAPEPCSEVYRYHPGDPGFACVSCDPNGQAPLGSADTTPQTAGGSFANPSSAGGFRTVSADGNRVFFDSPDKLVAADTNGDDGCLRGTVSPNYSSPWSCTDVYEWEADGSGSCHSTAQDGGCLYLLSSGTGPDPSFLSGSSASGDDVFIDTDDQLVPQDADHLYDVYDVRVDGGLASQHQAGVPPCGSAEQCHGQGTAPPEQLGAGTGAVSGPGNPPIHRKPHHKKRKAKKKHHKHSHRRAKPDRGGSK